MSAHRAIEIILPLEHDKDLHWPPVSAELIHADRVGFEIYRIENVPFYSLDVSLHDIVRVVDERGPRLTFAGVVKHSGSSCYRLMFDADSPHRESAVAFLLRHDAIIEEHPRLPLIAVAVDIEHDRTIFDYLNEGADQSKWSFEVGFNFAYDAAQKSALNGSEIVDA